MGPGAGARTSVVADAPAGQASVGLRQALWWSDGVCGGAIFSYGRVLPGSFALGILVTL